MASAPEGLGIGWPDVPFFPGVTIRYRITYSLWRRDRRNRADIRRSTRLQPADRGGAAPGAGLHVSSRLQLFSLVSGVKSLRRFYRLSFTLFFSVVVNLYCVKIQYKHKCELYFLWLGTRECPASFLALCSYKKTLARHLPVHCKCHTFEFWLWAFL